MPYTESIRADDPPSSQAPGIVPDAVSSDPPSGGRRRRRSSIKGRSRGRGKSRGRGRNGGTFLTEIATPVALLGATQYMKNRIRRKSLKRRRSRKTYKNKSQKRRR